MTGTPPGQSAPTSPSTEEMDEGSNPGEPHGRPAGPACSAHLRTRMTSSQRESHSHAAERSSLENTYRYMKHKWGNSLAVQWLGLGDFTAKVRVQSLVGELRSQKPRSTAKKKKTSQNPPQIICTLLHITVKESGIFMYL